MNNSEDTLTSQVSSGSQTMSTHSSKNKAIGNELDFTVDNTLSPIDLESKIQAERLTAVLDEIIYKSKVIVCLPRLVQEYNTLNSILTQEHMDNLLVIFEQYEKPLSSGGTLLNVAALDDIKAGNFKLRNRLSPELSHLVYILSKYNKLKGKVEEIIEEMQTKEQSKVKEDLFPSLIYLKTLEHFRALMVNQMEMTAAEMLTKKLNMIKISKSNEELKTTINEYLTTMVNEKATFEKKMREKRAILDELEKELAMLNIECNLNIKKTILDTERQMVLATRSHAVKSELLKEEEADNVEYFEIMLSTHLAEEKQLRARRLKVQGQLMSWLQKYDNEMQDKQVELEEMRDRHENEAKQVEKLEAEMAEQDKEYIPLMEEREAEYQEEMNQKMAMFRREHAARVMQFAWRSVRANRAEKRRLKKIAKRLEKEAAAAAKKKKK